MGGGFMRLGKLVVRSLKRIVGSRGSTVQPLGSEGIRQRIGEIASRAVRNMEVEPLGNYGTYRTGIAALNRIAEISGGENIVADFARFAAKRSDLEVGSSVTLATLRKPSLLFPGLSDPQKIRALAEVALTRMEKGSLGDLRTQRVGRRALGQILNLSKQDNPVAQFGYDAPWGDIRKASARMAGALRKLLAG